MPRRKRANVQETSSLKKKAKLRKLIKDVLIADSHKDFQL
jgi:hypothetical protein